MAVFKTLDPNQYNSPSGQGAIQLEGSTALTPIGDLMVTFDKTATKTEIRSNESPDRPVVATDYSEAGATVKITFRQMGVLGKALAFMGLSEKYTQTAVASKTQVFAGVTKLDWLELKAGANAAEEKASQGLVKTTVTAVTVAEEPLTLNVHYKHDSASGIVQIIEWPAGAEDGDEVEVTFTAAAVTSADGVDVVGILSRLSLRGRLVIRQNNRRGRNRKFVIPIISIGGDGGGSVNLVADSNDVQTVEVTATIETDDSQPAGRERGWVVDI